MLFDDGSFAAISSDLHEGDSVIVDGQLRVVPGGKVTIVKGDGAGERGGRGRGRGGRGRRGGGRRGGEDG
jgi:ATP-dependent RNA helicase DeaD